MGISLGLAVPAVVRPATWCAPVTKSAPSAPAQNPDRSKSQHLPAYLGPLLGKGIIGRGPDPTPLR